MSAELYDHPTEREALNILGDTSALDVGRARLLLEQNALAPDDFHHHGHAELFRIAVALIRESRPVDAVSVSAAAKGNQRLPVDIIAGILTGLAGGPHAYPGHVRTLRDLSLKRKALLALKDVQSDLMKPGSNVADILSRGASVWSTFTTGRKAYRNGSELLGEFTEELERAQSGEQTFCIPTGIDTWDQVFGGIECGVPTFVGAQPGVGKSAIFATWLENWARANVKVGIFSLEDRGTWIPRRHVAKAASIPNFILAKKPLTSAQMDRVFSSASDIGSFSYNYFVDDRSRLTPAEVEQTARDWVVNHGVRIILIDHLGKLNLEAQKFHRHDLAIEDALSRFTAVAKEYNIGLVIAAHLKRPEGANGADPRFMRPKTTDFAQAAFIERDARNAAGVYFSKDDPDLLLVAALKQTNGISDEDFPIRKLKSAAMVASKNGRLDDPYAEEARRMEAGQ